MDEGTKDQFRRIIDVVIERTSATDDELRGLREEFRASTNRILFAMNSVAKEVTDLRQGYRSINAAVYLFEATLDRHGRRHNIHGVDHR